MYEALEILFNILLIADKSSKTSSYFVVIFILNLLSLVSKNYLPYYFETSLELNQTESVRLTQFTTWSTEPRYFTSSMAEELKKRKNVRAGHKGQVTKVITVCNEILESFEPLHENRLKQQKITLDERLETIKQLDNQILEYLSTQSEIEKEIESAALFREPVYEVIVKIEEALSFCERERKKKEIQEQAVMGALSNANQPAVVVSTGTKSRLPKLTIKKFGGQPSGWQEFWDNFSSSVHDKTVD